MKDHNSSISPSQDKEPEKARQGRNRALVISAPARAGGCGVDQRAGARFGGLYGPKGVGWGETPILGLVFPN